MKNVFHIFLLFLLAPATAFAHVDSTAYAPALADSISVEKSTSDTTTEVVGNLSLASARQCGTLGPHYGFDVYSEEKKPFAGQYDQYVVHSKDKYASWMAMPQGSANVVYATIEGGTGSDMRFRMSGQDLPITKDSENENSVYVTVTNAGNCEAYYTTTDKKNNSIEVLAGQLNVATYPEQSVNLCIVEVNSTQYPYAINNVSSTNSKLNRHS